jgi:hypothetical protein
LGIDGDNIMRHYRVMLWGYGGEAAYLGLTKEQYDYWSDLRDEDEGVVIDYMVDPEEYVQENPVPENLDFLMWSNDFEEDDFNKYRNPWYEAPTEFAHAWGAAVQGSIRISVQEVVDDEYNSNMVKDGYELELHLEEHEEKYDSVEYGSLTEMGGEEPCVEPDYVCQFWSAEKGTFFETTISIDGEFDPSKLKFRTEEYPNGDDVILDVSYNDEIYDNVGGDTNGKGYSVHFWSNVNG